MAIIKSIKGVRYNLDKIKEIQTVMAPPYDVISPERQEELYAANPHNVIRLILGKVNPDDSENNNRYTRASVCFNQWLNDNTLVGDGEPSLYIYRQEYCFNNIKKTRTGFIAGYKLEEFGKGKIHPHENTLAKPKEDRLRLTRACGANFSPIFGLYSDPEETVLKSFAPAVAGSPLIDFRDEKGERHSLWRVTDRAIIDSAIECMRDKNILIADGHHRYETAVNYMNEMKAKGGSTGEEPYHYVMMYLTNTDSEGLSVFATHRVIGDLADFDPAALRSKISDYFTVETVNGVDSGSSIRESLLGRMKEKEENANVFGLYCGDDYLMLTLKERAIMDRLAPPERSRAWKSLDVSVLHTVLIENILGISEEHQRNQKNITYKVDAAEAAEVVKRGEAQVAVFLNPTRIKEIQDVVATGEKMPQKSTYFYPKLMSGLVINKLD